MDRFERQQNANIFALFTNEKFSVRKRVLECVCRAFYKTNINWAIGMSCSLFLLGITDDFNDFDILIDINDTKRFEEVFEKIGGVIDHSTQQKSIFCSPYYKEAEFMSIHFDLIGDITINSSGFTYKYVLHKDDVVHIALEENICVPVVPVEASYLLYGMMIPWQSRRVFKRDLCLNFLIKRGVNKKIITNANVPEELKMFN